MSDDKSTTTPTTTAAASSSSPTTATTPPTTTTVTSVTTPPAADTAPKSRSPKAPKPADPPSNEELRQKLLEEKQTKRDADLKVDRDKFEAALTVYVYSGPLSSITFANGYEVSLHPGALVFMPPNEQATKNLLERKYLEAASDADAKQARAARKGVN